MSEPVYPAILGLTPSERATLDEAIRLANQRADKVTRDTCQRCGGQGCDDCDPYVPEYRRSIKRWVRTI